MILTCALQYLIAWKRLGAVEDCVRVRRTGKPIDGRKAVQVRDAINWGDVVVSEIVSSMKALMSKHGGIVLRQLTNTSLIPIVIWFRAFPMSHWAVASTWVSPQWQGSYQVDNRWPLVSWWGTRQGSWEASCTTTRPTPWLVKSRKEILNWATPSWTFLLLVLTLDPCLVSLCTMHQTLQILSTFFSSKCTTKSSSKKWST